MLDESSLYFGWVDYLIFALTLTISLVIGIYYAWKGVGNSTTDYLLGGKTMGIFPIAMSFAASALSTQAMLGTPTDVYIMGAMMFWMPLALAIGSLIAAYVYLPLLQDLGILSISQYFELRYNSTVRRIFSGISLFGTLFYLSILTYGPSLALSQVTGLNVYIAATITFGVCTFYTTIGGLKAVVWSDTIQIFLMFGSMVALVIKGTMDVGIENVWERNYNSSRLEFFNFDPDLTTQKTVWSMMIGGGFFWTGGYTRNQGYFQRFLAVPTRRHAQKAIILHIFLVAVFFGFCYTSGLVAYSKYFDCDPIKAKFVSKADQIVPYFVMDTLGSIPGLPGLFVAGIFSASLSTLSTVLNGVALTILEDFVLPFMPNLNDSTATKVSQGISVGFGLISYALVFLVSNVKTIFETGLSIDAAVFGMSLGMFTLGMLVPWSNWIGVSVGMVLSYAAVVSVGALAQTARAQGMITNSQIKPTSIENCLHLNATIEALQQQDDGGHQEEAFYLLRVSYLWYALSGTFIVLIIGTLVSFLTKPQDPDQLDPKLVFRFLRNRVGRKRVSTVVQQQLVEMENKRKNGEPDNSMF